MQLARDCEKCWNAKEMIHNASTNVLLNLQQNVLVSRLQAEHPMSWLHVK